MNTEPKNNQTSSGLKLHPEQLSTDTNTQSKSYDASRNYLGSCSYIVHKGDIDPMNDEEFTKKLPG